MSCSAFEGKDPISLSTSDSLLCHLRPMLSRPCHALEIISTDMFVLPKVSTGLVLAFSLSEHWRGGLLTKIAARNYIHFSCERGGKHTLFPTLFKWCCISTDKTKSVVTTHQCYPQALWLAGCLEGGTWKNARRGRNRCVNDDFSSGFALMSSKCKFSYFSYFAPTTKCFCW